VLISRAWLTELLIDTVDLAARDDDELARALTGLGLEVEGIRRHGDALAGVVVAEVRSIAAHPAADKLRVVELHDGTALRTVVCGASNVPAPGGRVAFATPGTRLPGGMEIGARALRGVDSYGMICSELELDIGADASGIVILPEHLVVGTALVDAIAGIADTVIELGVTPNRPDALGHVGVARDLAVKLGAAWRPVIGGLPDVPEERGLVTLEAPDRCGRYFGVAFEDARIGPSPLNLRVRLHRLGLRALSNVVDVTNWVMMKWGQPLHAFDRARLHEGRVVVRTATAGEPLHTLDDRELELGTEDLVIADAHRPMALAGVMGGAESGVVATSSRLLLEAAWFHPAGVRRSARSHGVLTDSSHRFERGVDHGDGLQGACAEACALLQSLAHARPVARALAEGRRPKPMSIAFRPPRAELLLGIRVPDDEAERIFTGLGVAVTTAEAAPWQCLVPTHRPDLEREVDLVDELVRQWGLERLPMRASPPSQVRAETRVELRQRAHVQDTIVDALCELGLHEVVAFAFTRPEALAVTPEAGEGAAVVHVANPMRAEAGVLRTHLLPGLLDALALNVARHARPLGLFECGRVYRFGDHEVAEGPTAAVDRTLADERTRAAVLLSAGAHGDAAAEQAADPRRVGAALVHALRRLGHEAHVRMAPGTVSWLHPGAQAELVLGEIVVGRYGRVHPDLLVRWDLPRAVTAAYGELWLEAVPAAIVPRMRVLPRFPASSRDVSLDVATEVPAARIVEVIAQAEAQARGAGEDPPRLSIGDRGDAAIEIVDDYRGEGIVAGRRALLLRLHYRCASRSVTDAEVQALHTAILDAALRVLRGVDAVVRTR
jgi:phenylalanyl-tRNA synthetase beta chain